MTRPNTEEVENHVLNTVEDSLDYAEGYRLIATTPHRKIEDAWAVTMMVRANSLFDEFLELDGLRVRHISRRPDYFRVRMTVKDSEVRKLKKWL